MRCACLLALWCACAPVARAAYTPESPEVKAAIEKAIGFLNSPAAVDSRIGAKALCALAILKNNGPATHPKVGEAVEAIRAGIVDKSFDNDMYSLGIAIIFLCNADADRYRRDIEQLLQIQAQTQKPHGGWGYAAMQTGDTSMTQYAVLSMWEANEAGFEVPIERWEKVANWLLRTQSPEGAFGYQGNDPGTFERVAQSEVRLSMCAAGASSLYICSDRFGMVNLGPKNSGSGEDDLPDALKPVGGHRRRRSKQGGSANVEKNRMEEARSDVDRYIDKNFAVDVPQWVYYYLYALERYQSFREASEGKIEADAAWYDAGVKYILANQQEDGHFQGQCDPVADTSFAALFMLRSTRKSITKARYYGGGTLVGGRGLPHGEGGAFLRQGRVKRQALEGPADELFAAMDDPENEEYFRALEDLEELSFVGDADELDAQAAKLRKLVADGPPEARVAAVRSLARTRNLDHVPTLIQALEDPDAEVFREAVSGLRFMSRRLGDKDIPTAPTDEDRQAAIKDWRAWCLQVRPGTTFEPLDAN